MVLPFDDSIQVSLEDCPQLVMVPLIDALGVNGESFEVIEAAASCCHSRVQSSYPYDA